MPAAIPESEWEVFQKELQLSEYKVVFPREERCLIFDEGQDRLWRYDLWTRERLNKALGGYGLSKDAVDTLFNLSKESMSEPYWLLTHSATW